MRPRPVILVAAVLDLTAERFDVVQLLRQSSLGETVTGLFRYCGTRVMDHIEPFRYVI